MDFTSIKALKNLNDKYKVFNGEAISSYYKRLLRIKSPDIAFNQVSFNPAWSNWYTREKNRLLESSIRPFIVDFHHIGSTAINGMSSKNIIDIACIVKNSPLDDFIINELDKLNFKFYGNSPINPDVYWFWSIRGNTAYVIHICKHGNNCFESLLSFRDYLEKHPHERELYMTEKNKHSCKCNSLFLYSIKKLEIMCELFERAAAWKKSQ